jgi:hypothetical protein
MGRSFTQARPDEAGNQSENASSKQNSRFGLTALHDEVNEPSEHQNQGHRSDP